MEKLFEFKLTRFRLIGDQVKVSDIKYQMPANSEIEAVYKLGMTFNSSFPVESVDEGIKLTLEGNNEQKAIIIHEIRQVYY